MVKWMYLTIRLLTRMQKKGFQQNVYPLVVHHTVEKKNRDSIVPGNLSHLSS